jgi:hypothetical protein
LIRNGLNAQQGKRLTGKPLPFQVVGGRRKGTDMPSYNVTAPDGTTYTVNAPDGASEQDAIAYVQKNLYKPKEQEKINYAEGMGVGGKLLTGIGAGMAGFGRGIKQAVTTNPVELKRLQDEEVESRRFEESLGGAGIAGKVIGSAAPALPLMMIPGANTVTGATALGALQGAASPLVENESRLATTALGGVLGGAAQKFAPDAARWLGNKVYQSGQQKSINAARDEILRESRKAGFVVPKSETGGGTLNNLMESIAGKAALKQEAAIRNAETRRQLAAKSVGLPVDEVITPDALRTLRTQQADVGYKPIEQTGLLNWTPDYQTSMKAIDTQIGRPSARVESLRNPEVSKLVQDLDVDQIAGKEVVDLIKNLRETGNKSAYANYGVDPLKKDLGKAQIKAATALEDLAEQNLAIRGNPGAAKALREARTKIAQNFMVEKSLNGAGDVSAKEFVKAAKKGIPLSGEQKQIADFAQRFPKFSGDLASTPAPDVSATNAMSMPLLGAATSGASGNPAGWLAAGLPLLRDPMRSILLSNRYQQMASPRYFTDGPLSVLPGMLDRESTQMLRQALIPTGGLLAYEGY